MSSANRTDEPAGAGGYLRRGRPKMAPATRTGLRFGVPAVASGALAVALALPAPAGASTVSGTSHRATGYSSRTPDNGLTSSCCHGRQTVRVLTLRPMPAGTVTFGRDGRGGLTVRVVMFGLTPGSSHTVELQAPGGTATITRFDLLSAGRFGQADATLHSNYLGRPAAGSRVVVRLGTQDGGIAAEPVGETAPLTRSAGQRPYRLTEVEVHPGGVASGRSNGRARIVYHPKSHTLTVTINATGLTPGAHAAHIHLGSCRDQGAVKYMLNDLVADRHGNLVNEVRVIPGVTAPIPARGWYVNIHQGDSNTIVRNGQPTSYFRPLLCADI